ncbi:MAG TPA: TIGR03618 family F420-dependent PPOX class oxidoreductase [Terriglobales bacterium]|nr:TIGR03618 family F420-dependent PPOX class oxidoreductase [Terriglobales bacterium]
MDTEAIQAFLAQPHDAVIATNRPGKAPQLSTVWVLWDGESFVFTTEKTTAKYANIVRDPNIAVMVNDSATHTYVNAYGRAEMVEPERYPELWNALFEKYVPAEIREQSIEANKAYEQAARIIIVLKPEKIISYGWDALATQ